MVLKLFRDWLNMTFKMFDNSSKRKKKLPMTEVAVPGSSPKEELCLEFALNVAKQGTG